MRVLFLYIKVREIDYKKIESSFEIGVSVISPQSLAAVKSCYLIFRLGCKAVAWGTHVRFWNRSSQQLDIQIVLREFTFANNRYFIMCKIASVSFDRLSTTEDIFVKFGVKSVLRPLQWSTAIAQNFHKPQNVIRQEMFTPRELLLCIWCRQMQVIYQGSETLLMTASGSLT